MYSAPTAPGAGDADTNNAEMGFPAASYRRATSNATRAPMLWPKNATVPSVGAGSSFITRSARSGMLRNDVRSWVPPLPGYCTATRLRSVVKALANGT